MKKIVWFLAITILSVSCNSVPVKKPDNLIDQEKMTGILYDLTLLESIKSQRKYDSVIGWIGTKELIFIKYDIDSVQFAQSNQYYVSQIDVYKKMYDDVAARIESKKAAK
jgi:Domain of unknown function (DUF4296)